jgi:nitrate reductase gamma subunit
VQMPKRAELVYAIALYAAMAMIWGGLIGTLLSAAITGLFGCLARRLSRR